MPGLRCRMVRRVETVSKSTRHPDCRQYRGMIAVALAGALLPGSLRSNPASVVRNDRRCSVS